MSVDKIIACLKKGYPPGRFTSHDPFRSLIATVLSQRTRDEVTNKAAERLFVKYGNPEALSHAGASPGIWGRNPGAVLSLPFPRTYPGTALMRTPSIAVDFFSESYIDSITNRQ